MDRSAMKTIFRKYKYAALVILAGLMLLLLPEGEKEAPPVPTESREVTLEESLAALLSQVQGAGKTRVLLTELRGEQILYQTDDTDSRSTTVLVSEGNREETGLIRQRIPPVYQGAVVVCQGAENAGVRLAIVSAVMSVTGLTSDKITVLKMH